MGIESDQLVYDYLSRVGDLAQRRQLPSAARMRLVSGLRDEIDRRRAKFGADSPAAVRRILGRLGTPDEVVESVSTAGAYEAPPEVETAGRGVPGQRDGGRGRRQIFPRPRESSPPPAPAPPPPPPVTAASPPHLAGMDELGPSEGEPDWWRIEPGPFGGGPGESVAGFVGGVEIPEILRPPQDVTKAEEAAKARDAEASVEAVGAVGAVGAVEEPPAPSRSWRTALPRPGFSSPLLMLAAALLVVGAALGNWLALGGGWLLAYVSRRLTPAETKWAVLGLPGLSVAAGAVWLWGRQDGRWGSPIADGAMGDAVAGVWPWVVRGAALGSAAFLVWRGGRRR